MALTSPTWRPKDNPDSAFASVWRVPLAPVALAVTVGIVADRALDVPPSAAMIALGVGLVGWLAGLSKSAAAGLPFLWLALAAIGALHHHQYRTIFAADDIGRLAGPEPRLIRLRGRLTEEPTVPGVPLADPLRSMPRAEPARTVVAVTHIQDRNDWRPVSGRIRLVAAGPLDGLHAGDFAEAVGWLSLPGEPANPGELPVAHFLDERITALLSVHKTSDGVVRLAEGWSDSPAGWLATLRGWGRRTLESALPPERSGVAAALVLGDGSAMAQAEWDKYIRTGVMHALAISGQHLIILATFLWLVLRVAGLPRKRGAWIVAIVLIVYAAMAGGRPPAIRAATMVALVCGGLILRRVMLPANALALALLIVLAIQPTDVVDTGCQLSFLCVAILTWGESRWIVPREPDALEVLVDAARPAWLRALRSVGRWLLVSYAITFVLGLSVIPLVAHRYHVVSPIGIAIGPPVVFLAAIALVAGFLLLIAATILPPLVPLFGWATDVSLRLCGWIVEHADRVPYGHWFVGDVPGWWLAVFYGGLLSGADFADGSGAVAAAGLGRRRLDDLRPGVGDVAIGAGRVSHDISCRRPRRLHGAGNIRRARRNLTTPRIGRTGRDEPADRTIPLVPRHSPD